MITVWAPDGVGEIREGDDVAAVFLAALAGTGRLLHDGDVVAVTSKVVSKAEGRARVSTRDVELPGQTRRVVARRGPTTIVRNLLGLTMAAAGIDGSNVAAGTVLLLPEDPDASARRIRATVLERTGANVGVVVTDTAGRAWRDGQTDLAIGAAGITVLQSFAGRFDAHGNPLLVTAPAVADEIASAAELAQGKLGSRPFAVVRGRADLVLPAGDDGTGAGTLVRPEGADLFGYGAREAVVRALAGRPEDRAPFGAPATVDEMAEAVTTVTGAAATTDGDALVVTGDTAALRALAFAFGWTLTTESGGLARLCPPTP
ncbi:coenzyme F420-0:L-glutamate ligase [Nocardioides sp. CER19]|uniref:coenzyme F420-0:L-glutamate ligase n=1 Tax=Nocardioides sp. CER19 TaxID=3038538 RepID=UPI00244871FC|nr:coenzyme F420-0:L-glutamate ligase [Nocardioides sp. CER19]MDH2415115.1 coenzyme F420-0:L-glutamate ligase [Nocardioides sp. CER19]